MTVDSQILSEQHPGDGLNDEFEFGFKIEVATELVVTLIEDATGAATLQTLTTHYTVSIDEDDHTGTVTMVTAPPVGYTLDLRPVYELLQPTRIRNQGRFLPEIHEAAFDRQVVANQYLYRLVRRCLRLPDISDSQSGELAPRANWLERFPFINATGQLEPAAAIALTVLSQSVVGGLLYGLQTSFEALASVVPTNVFYEELNVLRYGADPSGAADSTAAFNKAIAVQKQHGCGEVLVPPGLYKVNLVITGSGIHMRALGHDKYDDNGGTVGFIANTATDPVLQIGDGVLTTRGLTFTGISVIGVSGADKGIRIYGANRVHFHRCAVRAFDEYQIQIDSSATLSTSRIHWDRLDLATGTAAGSLGLDFNYGASSATAIFFSNSSLSAAAGGGHIIDLEDDAQVRFVNSWLQCRNLQGIRFRGTNSRLAGAGVIIDSNSSADVLFEFDNSTLLGDQVAGTIAADGIARMPAGDTAALTGRNYLTRSSIARELHIQSALNFQDSALAEHLQHAAGNQNQRITRTGAALQLRSTDGNVEARLAADGELVLREDGTTAAARLRFGVSGALVIYGTATPEGAVAAPKGSLFLRADGGAGTTLYVKETGSGNTGWVGK